MRALRNRRDAHTLPPSYACTHTRLPPTLARPPPHLHVLACGCAVVLIAQEQQLVARPVVQPVLREGAWVHGGAHDQWLARRGDNDTELRQASFADGACRHSALLVPCPPPRPNLCGLPRAPYVWVLLTRARAWN